MSAFFETDSTGQMDFIFVRYSAANYGLPNYNRFGFQGNLITVNRMWKSMCNVFAQIFLNICGLFNDALISNGGVIGE
jgi:hypothetical protein